MNLLLFIGALTPYSFPIETLQLKSEQEHFIEFCLRNVDQDSIPTSIKIAQAILESDWGKSKLAKKLNFHGIKCFQNCKEVLYLSDDKPNEKFRVFNSPRESFEFNNRLLKKHFIRGDYKAWAKSLTWYATSRRYEARIIEIIEQHKLYKHDKVPRITS
jgi:flagellum-specific peptidoglycan hydrolase FlgJ